MLPVLHTTFRLCRKKSTRRPFIASGQFIPQSAAYFLQAVWRRRTVLPGANPRCRWILALWVVLTHLESLAQSQIYETFDTPRPQFRLWQSDAKAQLLPTRKNDPDLEVIEVAYGNGSYVHLIYPIDRCAVIEDLNASIRIRTAQSGLRIGFRVVFPRSTHPATHDPITEVLLGSPIEGAGRWSTSSIANVMPLFDERVRYLRTRYGSGIDLSDPFVDGVVLSVYTWHGTLKMQVDDLRVEGMVAHTLSQAKDEFSIGGGPDIGNQSIPEQLRSLQASVPRWISHQGESLDYLKSLGFTAILTNRPNDPLIVEQSVRSQLGVIGPPPEFVPSEDVAADYRHVQGWLLGMARDQSHLDDTRRTVSKLSRFPGSLSRPTFTEPMEMYGAYSRLNDLTAVPMPLPTRVRSSKEEASIMQSDLRPMAGRSIPLTSMATQMPGDWISQKAMAMRGLDGQIGRPLDYDLLQVRMQFYRSLMQGARGWIFRSGSPLDSADPTSMSRSQGYAGINQEIELLKPWIRAGQSSWTNVTTDSKEHTAAVLETPNSQLAIIVASGPMDQICAISPSAERIRITLPMSGQLRNVFRITHGELESLRPEQTPNGMVITIENPGLIEQVVTVLDPKPVAYLRDQLELLKPNLLESRMNIAEQVLEIAQMCLIARRVPSSDPQSEEIRRALAFQRESTQFLARSNIPRALKSSDRALLSAQRVVRLSWDEAAKQFSAFQSSPLVASPLSLPLHWEYHRLLEGRVWQALELPGIPWRDTAQLQTQAWQIDRRLSENIATECSIGALGPDNKPTMVLTAKPLTSQPISSGYAGAAMRVSSPPIMAPVGSLVFIQGLVNIESRADETQSGLLICDSLGGESLGQLVSSADPSSYAWRRFGLIRFVTKPEGMRLHFETRGEIRAILSDLKVEMIMPTASPGIPTRSIDPADQIP